MSNNSMTRIFDPSVCFSRKVFLFVLFLLYVGTLVYAQTGQGEFRQVGLATREMAGTGLYAAHPSLAIGLKARVTNPVNDKTIEVTITKRIGTSSSRIIDLSYEAWITLGLGAGESAGVIITVPPPPRPQPSAPILPPRPSNNATTGIEGALEKAAKEAIKKVQQHSSIAIVYITAADQSTTDFIAGELEFIWVNSGCRIIDRSQLEVIRQEQNFQLSGEVDDATAVSIGKFAGADYIATGRVDGEGNLRRLRLRVINTQTAQVTGAASERY